MKKYLLATLAASLLITSASASTYNAADLFRFEQTNECNSCDLSGAQLGYNHSGADLTYANLSRIYVNPDTSVNLSAANLSYANLSMANLTGTHLDGAVLTHANLFGASNADVTNAYLCNTILPNGTVTDCPTGP